MEPRLLNVNGNSPTRAEQPFGTPKLGLFWLCAKNHPPGAVFQHLFPVFCLFLQNEPNSVFFLNLFIPRRFQVFQLGSFGRNTLFYRGLPARRHVFGLPACLYDPCSHPNSPTLPENSLVHFGRFGRFGSFFHCEVWSRAAGSGGAESDETPSRQTQHRRWPEGRAERERASATFGSFSWL